MKTCTPSLITRKYLKVIFIDPFEQNPSFTFFLLQLLLLSNDVAENPGPDNKVGDLTVFHWNAMVEI
jgi:hypothetical protein